MSAMENMVRMILKSFDVDPEAIKKDVLGRVEAFEANVKTLNDTLALLLETQARIELKLDTIALEQGYGLVRPDVFIPPTAKSNGDDNAATGHYTGTPLLISEGSGEND